MGRPFSLSADQTQECISMYFNEKKTLKQIAEKFGVSRWTTTEVLKRHGMSRRNSEENRKTQLDNTVFNELNPASEYWMGFLCADGLVKRHHGRELIVLKLANIDIGHLMAFRDFAKSGHTVTKTQDNKSSFGFSSKTMCSALKKHGIYGYKPGRFPTTELGMSKHFWRGVCDGDGCITFKGMRPMVIINAWPNLMEKFLKFADSHGITKRSKVTDRRESISTVTFSGESAVSLLNVLYSEPGPCLPRKQELYKKALLYRKNKRHNSY